MTRFPNGCFSILWFPTINKSKKKPSGFQPEEKQRPEKKKTCIPFYGVQ
jgi:hypothetical protein